MMERRRIRSKNWTTFNRLIKDQCDKIAEQIADEFGEKSVRCYKGSYSFIFKSNNSIKTIAKLIPQDEYDESILAAFSDSLENAEEFAKRLSSFAEHIDFMGEPFWASKMKEGDINLTAKTIIDFVKSNME